MKRLFRLDRELYVAFAWLLIAGVGWWLRTVPLAIIGVLGAVTASAFYIWQRECLVGVSYHRKLGQRRAMFDERVVLEIEMVNDKLLPLSWCRVSDTVPAALQIEGGTVVTESASVHRLVHLLPMFCYQRIRRRLTVVCDTRGVHTFGPTTISSGDPVGLRTRSMQLKDLQVLLVYPKVYALAPAGVASRVLVGEARSRYELLQDPSRIAGVREYRPGDPVRNIDWRATARSTEILVREFEPSVALRVALFVDFRVSHVHVMSPDVSEIEFTIAVAASVVSDLVDRKVATGLFSSGAIIGQPLAYPPSSSPAALPQMLEGLARASRSSDVEFPDVLSVESGKLTRGTSVVVVATDFPESTLRAMVDLRRRYAVTAIWVETERGSRPPRELVDVLLCARYSDDWKQQQVLELAS